VIVAGLFFLSRNGGDELNLSQEAYIEKMWDDDALDGAVNADKESTGFVPAPPPMDYKSSSTANEEE